MEGHLKERSEFGDPVHQRAYSRFLDEKEGYQPKPQTAQVAGEATVVPPVEPAAPAESSPATPVTDEPKKPEEE
jgi:hypothetical protein